MLRYQPLRGGPPMHQPGDSWKEPFPDGRAGRTHVTVVPVTHVSHRLFSLRHPVQQTHTDVRRMQVQCEQWFRA